MAGADWMLKKVLDRAPHEKKLKAAPTPLELDQVERFLEDAAGDGKKLAHGIRAGVTALEALKTSGLTGEALVVLVTEKCGTYVTEGKRTMRPSANAVRCVLEGLFQLGEYVHG